MNKRKIFLVAIIVVLTAGFFAAYRFAHSKPNTEQAFPGCKCHSKNLSLVKMHKEFTPMECGGCHKGGPVSSKVKKGSLADKKFKSKLCTRCHKRPNKTVASGNSQKMYCFKSKKYYPKGTKVCPEHGDPLIDLDKLVKLADEKPSKKICLACHPVTNELIKYHKTKKKVIDASANCIKCHKKHLKCDGCHY